MNHRQQSLFTYLQDDFKLNSKITLNPGLRYELVTPFYERVNLLSNWDPKTNTILKAKSGSIYDRALVNLDKNNFGPRFVLASAAQTPGTPGFLNTQQEFPADFTSPEKFNPRLSTVQHYDPNAPWGEVHSWFVSIQQQLPMGIVLDVGYVGNRGDKLITINDINQARPNRIDENLNIEARRPNLAYSSISGSIANGFSPYNGLQVKVEKRSERGFYFLNSFTWSRAIDNSSQAFDNNNNGTSFQDVYNIAADKGLSNYHRNFNNITSVVYELPIGKGRKFLSGAPRAVDLLAGGWQVNSIVNLRSGDPFNMVYTAAARSQVAPFLTLLGFNVFRPNISGNPLQPEGQRTVGQYLDRTTVSIPLYYEPFGNAGRNVLRGFAFYQTDVGISKRFVITERVGMQLRAEAFNLFNRSNFRAPNANISAVTFGTITSAYDARQLQLALKLQF